MLFGVFVFFALGAPRFGGNELKYPHYCWKVFPTNHTIKLRNVRNHTCLHLFCTTSNVLIQNMSRKVQNSIVSGDTGLRNWLDWWWLKNQNHFYLGRYSNLTNMRWNHQLGPVLDCKIETKKSKNFWQLATCYQWYSNIRRSERGVSRVFLTKGNASQAQLVFAKNNWSLLVLSMSHLLACCFGEISQKTFVFGNNWVFQTISCKFV